MPISKESGLINEGSSNTRQLWGAILKHTSDIHVGLSDFWGRKGPGLTDSSEKY